MLRRLILFIYLFVLTFSFTAISQELLNVNLLANPDAEIESTDVVAAGWKNSHDGEPQREVYGHTGGEFDWDWGKDKGYGNSYFRASVMKVEPKNLSQVIDLGGISDLINSGEINYSLGGYFGGGNDATTFLEAVFFDKDGKVISRTSTPPLKNSEKPEPLDLYSRSISGLVPKGTMRAEIFLRFEYNGDFDNCANMAVADNLSFTLNKNTK